MLCFTDSLTSDATFAQHKFLEQACTQAEIVECLDRAAYARSIMSSSEDEEGEEG